MEVANKTLETTCKMLDTRTDRDGQKHLVEAHVNPEKVPSGQTKGQFDG